MTELQKLKVLGVAVSMGAAIFGASSRPSRAQAISPTPVTRQSSAAIRVTALVPELQHYQKLYPEVKPDGFTRSGVQPFFSKDAPQDTRSWDAWFQERVRRYESNKTLTNAEYARLRDAMEQMALKDASLDVPASDPKYFARMGAAVVDAANRVFAGLAITNPSKELQTVMLAHLGTKAVACRGKYRELNSYTPKQMSMVLSRIESGVEGAPYPPVLFKEFGLEGPCGYSIPVGRDVVRNALRYAGLKSQAYYVEGSVHTIDHAVAAEPGSNHGWVGVKVVSDDGKVMKLLGDCTWSENGPYSEASTGSQPENFSISREGGELLRAQICPTYWSSGTLRFGDRQDIFFLGNTKKGFGWKPWRAKVQERKNCAKLQEVYSEGGYL